MRLATFEFQGERRIGAVVGDRIVDLAAAHKGWLESQGGDLVQTLPTTEARRVIMPFVAKRLDASLPRTPGLSAA